MTRAQAAAYTPFMRAHAHLDTKRREPWLFERPVTAVIRRAIRDHYRLLPHWYTLFWQGERTGTYGTLGTTLKPAAALVQSLLAERAYWYVWYIRTTLPPVAALQHALLRVGTYGTLGTTLPPAAALVHALQAEQAYWYLRYIRDHTAACCSTGTRSSGRASVLVRIVH